ncbi:MAG: T9SS type A sorting domain-containing protein, partial [Schleiferiaceae bacterium]|nr:T9SS type A sorting domain-containing protein [Schleiferiaceae bacterium]
NYVIDYNLFYSGGSTLASDGGLYTDLAAWKSSAPSFNMNSLEGDPIFTSADDLHILGTIPNDVADNSLSIATDIDGDARPASGSTIADIGADEFTPKNVDIAVVQYLSPVSSCGDSITPIVVVVRNMGTDTITSFNITSTISGSLSANVNYTFTGSLASLEFDTIHVGDINTYGGGQVVDFMTYATLVNDEDGSNDTITQKSFFIPSAPVTEDQIEVCYDANQNAFLKAKQFPGTFYNWYANSTDTVPFASGDSINFSMGNQTTWYLGYASGIKDSLSSIGFTGTFGGQGIAFDIHAKANIQITGFGLNSGAPAGDTVSVTIYHIPDASYEDHAENFGSWVALDTVMFVSAGSGLESKVLLNNPIMIPIGSKNAIYLDYNCNWEFGNSLNKVKQSPFMTYEGGVGYWGSNLSSSTSNKIFDGVIYAENFVCSDTKTQVDLLLNPDTAIANMVAMVTQPDSIHVDASASQGHLVEWFFGDSGYTTGTTASYQYANGGTYNVMCVVTDTVCNTTDTAYYNAIVTIGITENELSQNFMVYPNPSENIFNISFEILNPRNITLEVVDGMGRVIVTESLGNSNSIQNHPIDLSNSEGGVYFIRLSTDDITAVKRVIKL